MTVPIPLLAGCALAVCALAACSRSAPPEAPPPTTQLPAPQATPAPPLVTTTIPERFQGAWASDDAACTTAGHESRLLVSADRLEFHESSGPVKEATVNGDDITVVTTLTGEGQTREATHRFTLSPDGRTLTDRDAGMIRHRCDG